MHRFMALFASVTINMLRNSMLKHGIGNNLNQIFQALIGNIGFIINNIFPLMLFSSNNIVEVHEVIQSMLKCL